MFRRTFLKTLSGTAMAAAAVGAETPIPLGYDTYSINSYRWKAVQLLEYGASLGLDTVQISSLNDYESLEPAHLQKVKERAAQLGLMIDGGIGCICPLASGYRPVEGGPEAYLAQGLSACRDVGSKVMRCYIGSPADRRGGHPAEAFMESAIKTFRAVRQQALDAGVKIALENHGELTAREVKTVLDESGADAVGSCLDTGNPMWGLEDPMTTLEILGPYAATSHFRGHGDLRASTGSGGSVGRAR
jgi:3-oxoisoapionate decarboxylase